MRRALATLAFLALAPTARAAEPRASAVELFAHGRALAASGKCADAIPFFLDTLKLEPSIGALLNLAECREKLADHAGAYEAFRRAEALARAQGDDRAALAHERAGAVAASLATIAIAAPEGVAVTLDGAPASGTVVVAPGEHVVRATAPGRAPWSTSVLAQLGSTAAVSVPELRAIALAPAPRPVGGAQRVAGASVASLGAAGLALSAVLGGLAIEKKNDALALATGPSRSDFDAARASAASFADASTWTLAASAIVLAAGVVVWLAAPRARVAVAPGGIAARF